MLHHLAPGINGEPDLAVELADDLDADGPGGCEAWPTVASISKGKLHKR